MMAIRERAWTRVVAPTGKRFPERENEAMGHTFHLKDCSIISLRQILASILGLMSDAESCLLTKENRVLIDRQVETSSTREFAPDDEWHTLMIIHKSLGFEPVLFKVTNEEA